MNALRKPVPGEIHYPDSDGKPMADNTLQYEEIVTCKGNLDFALPDFVAGDLLWYPVEGQPRICQAPDVLVALGRPKGHRRSYRQWEENNVAPAVVFEIMSDSNDWPEMVKKGHFYAAHGVREFYVYDPQNPTLRGWLIQDHDMMDIVPMNGWTSPLLGVRFTLDAQGKLAMLHANGERFLSFAELNAKARTEKERADTQQQRADALAARLRELGVEV